MDYKIAVWNITSINKEKKQKEIRQLIQNEQLHVCAVLETHIKSTNIKKVCDNTFGSWERASNSSFSSNGCRIMVGWNDNMVKVRILHLSRQSMLCDIENLYDQKRLFCSFIYASNYGGERRDLWKDLDLYSRITKGQPWVIMRDFNVTLKIDEHSASGSFITQDMQEFSDYINNIDVEDICYSGLHYTWIKSPKNPQTSVLKHLDRVMINDDFMIEYSLELLAYYLLNFKFCLAH
ncbi:RNA-directed DNA polymerase, eukaryota, reverse transcriptase zinc-binding domain protein [Tanacetum coccineum]